MYEPITSLKIGLLIAKKMNGKINVTASDIRKKATEAVTTTDISSAREVVSVARSEWELDYEQLKGKYKDFKAYAHEKLKESEIYNISVSNNGAVNMIYIDKNKDTAIIPEGFIASQAAGENTINYGLVIYEGDEPVTDENVDIARQTRNQFVWVPVDDMEFFRTWAADMRIPPIQTLVCTLKEPYELVGDPMGERAEYNAMKASVEENGGFYIARYEAGKEGTKVVSKKNARVWNNIAWSGTNGTEIGIDGAVYKAREMYGKAKSVVSTLCYGVEWDTTLEFIMEKGDKDTSYVEYGGGNGWNKWVNGNSDHLTGVDLGDLASNKLNNIYDMSGNVREWTMEADIYDEHNIKRLTRGNDYETESGNEPPKSFSEKTPTTSSNVIGFRVALYIK